MDSADILLEQIKLLDFDIAVAEGRLEAVSQEDGERFIVYGDDLFEMADEMLGLIQKNLEDSL